MDNIQTVTYQCPNCNAALEYDNSSGKFRCFYCDSTFTDEEIKKIFAENEHINLDGSEPELTEEQQQDEEFTGQSALYTCPNCGAGVICDTLTASTRCHFCHTPVILSGRLSGEYKPDMIIPFYTTREQAEENFKKYMKGKFLLPKDFNTEATIKNIDALYVPYWLKSGLCDVNLNAQGKIIRTWRSGDRRYTHTKVFHVEREAEMAFIRVPCDGSKRIDDALMESIEPFSYTGLKPFSMSYLSGCKAEKYDVPKADAAVRIDERINTAATEEILKMVRGKYNAVESINTSVRYLNQQYVYALLPVWFLNYTYKGKDYAFVMNGQTGTMFGHLPVSKLKAFLFGGAILLGQWLLLMLFGGACGGFLQ